MTAQTAAVGSSGPNDFGPYVRYYTGLLCYSALIVFLTLFCLLVIPKALYGWKSFAVTSDSMNPGIRAGDVVVAKPVDTATLEPGSVIIFEDPAGRGILTHRLIMIEDDGLLRTRGDANLALDSDPVSPTAVVGEGQILVPFLGLPQVWIEQRNLANLLAVSIATVGIIWCTRWGVLPKYNPWTNRASAPEAGPEPQPASAPIPFPGSAYSPPKEPEHHDGPSRAAAIGLLSAGLATSTALVLIGNGVGGIL